MSPDLFFWQPSTLKQTSCQQILDMLIFDNLSSQETKTSPKNQLKLTVCNTVQVQYNDLVSAVTTNKFIIQFPTVFCQPILLLKHY